MSGKRLSLLLFKQFYWDNGSKVFMASMRAVVHWLDWGLWRHRALPQRLGSEVLISSGFFPPPQDAVFIGWGLKRSGIRARQLAQRFARPCWLLEDGFIRSMGGNKSTSLSLIVDDEGIYYDASRPSKLERLVSKKLDDKQVSRARDLIKSWRDGRVSKYNHMREWKAAQLPDRYVLVIDQTFGDAAIEGGLANSRTFSAMLSHALDENPDCRVVLKVHPEAISGSKRGHFDLAALKANSRILIVATEVHPATVIEGARSVYTVTSQLGFEALLWGKPVHVYGMPFYAGWGLTIDRQPPPSRRSSASLEQLAYGALIEYARYFHPETQQPCEIEVLLDWFGMQRRLRERYAPELCAYKFSKWKQPYVSEFLAGSKIVFVNQLAQYRNGSTPLVSWGHKHTNEITALRENAPKKILRIEDGFIRSVGLGADLIRPLSWVVDETGIYYDSSHPSDLENLLAQTDFRPDLITRAAKLRSALVENGVTKYNLQNSKTWQRPATPVLVILIPGQVETDAAIKYGSPKIKRNIDLLKSVRELLPDAWIVYKPHPDVLAGLRSEGEDENQALHWCNEIVTDASLERLLPHVDEVHVLSSLSGFEALLRGVPVTTWGEPFYAGWGLTIDQGLTPETARRRSRKLSIEELVAATLILYPTYVSRFTRHFCTPERALEEILAWRSERPHSYVRRLIAKAFRKP